MFPLFRDRTRRLICRSMFLLLGVLPTGAVLAWSAVLNGDRYHDAVCQQLAASLGYEVRADRVTHPRTESTLLEGFQIVDPETQDVLFSSRRIEIREDEHLTITAVQPELRFTKNSWYWSVLERRLRLGAPNYRPLKFHAEVGTISWPEGKQSIDDCAVEIKAVEESNMATANFHWGEQQSPEPVQLQLQRSKSADRLVSIFKLQTGVTALPCTLLAAAFGQQNRLGAECKFQGKLQADEGESGWIATITDGTFTEVDLNALAIDYFPGHCAARAELQLSQAAIHQGRIIGAQGTLIAGRGTASRVQIDAIVDSVKLIPARNIAPQEVSFDQLAIEFNIDAASTQILGTCGGPHAGIVLRSSHGPILGQPQAPLPRTRMW
jgi:hypothetical protein